MIATSVHIHLKTEPFDLQSCLVGSWLVLLHARRIPPHVGLVINGHYNSLTVKGHELDVPVEAIYKAVQLKKIESLFIKVIDHPVFSRDYQLAVLQEMIQSYPSVKHDVATCLSPLKEFFQEFYALPLQANELLFDFITRLNANHYLEKALPINIHLAEEGIELPFYTIKLLHEKIKNERLPFYNDSH